MINAGCRAELVLACIDKRAEHGEPEGAVNQDYLSKPLRYVDDKVCETLIHNSCL